MIIKEATALRGAAIGGSVLGLGNAARQAYKDRGKAMSRKERLLSAGKAGAKGGAVGAGVGGAVGYAHARGKSSGYSDGYEKGTARGHERGYNKGQIDALTEFNKQLEQLTKKSKRPYK
ncbi:MAG: hypothetical protein ACR2MS_02650 [Weeksellaceae bacterium]